MWKLDGDIELEPRRRVRLIDRRSVDDANRFRQLQKVRRTIECRKSGLAQRRQKRCRAPIENRGLRTVHVDRQVVDAEADDRGQHVLDGVHRMIALPELGAPLTGRDLAHVRTDPRRSGTIGAPENDSLPGLGRLKRYPTRNPEVEADALQRHRTGNRLSTHLDSGSPSSFSRRRIMPANLNSAAEARSASRCGRAGYPDQVSPAGMSPKTPACAA